MANRDTVTVTVTVLFHRYCSVRSGRKKSFDYKNRDTDCTCTGREREREGPGGRVGDGVGFIVPSSHAVSPVRVVKKVLYLVGQREVQYQLPYRTSRVRERQVAEQRADAERNVRCRFSSTSRAG
jgi:hypothetical protein